MRSALRLRTLGCCLCLFCMCTGPLAWLWSADTKVPPPAKPTEVKPPVVKPPAAKPPVVVVLPDPKTPTEANKEMLPADDLRVQQVLADPVVAQPIFTTFDERGRLWVVQYLQYPFPAGLKILSEDKFLRATYDKVPPPPPNHFVGRDKITIHEDTDGDGVFDKHKTFVEGLNIATSCAKGKDGVWVLNPPYLLFYPDKNHDDIPDGPPEVHLEGFGMEDTHSCANSLQWGPDGWLYSAQGSTVTGRVKRFGSKDEPVHSMGQLIWRYHPQQKRYEIFAEGGGNAFGVEIDSKGRIFSGHNGGDTRGFHYVQGGYSQKGFTKHGPLSNPYAFGYFPAMKHPSVPRFSHNFILYEGHALPKRYDHKLFAVAPLQGQVMTSDFFPDRSSFQSKDTHLALGSKDVWFRPVDVKLGPDGAVYVADMYEAHIAHLRHHEGKIDITNGRIYRLQSPDAQPAKTPDYGRYTSAQLVDLLKHDNKWQRRTALRLLSERRDLEVKTNLLQLLASDHPQHALEALWALNLIGAFDDTLALQALKHRDPHVRAWSVRLLGDAKTVSAPCFTQLVQLAGAEREVLVRSQLACTARRLPTEQCLGLLKPLLAHDEDSDDIHLPMLLWWALEAKCGTDREKVLALFEHSELWRGKLVQTHLLHRLMRRFAAAGSRKDLLVCAQLLQLAPDADASKRLIKGIEEAWQGRSLTSLPAELSAALAKFGGDSIGLGLRQNKPEAIAKALTVIENEKADLNERLQYVQILGELQQPKCVPTLLAQLQKTKDDTLRSTLLNALQGYADPEIAQAVLKLYPQLTEEVRSIALTLLTSRKTFALALVQAVEAGSIEKSALPLEAVRRLTAHRDDELAKLVKKHWSNIAGATTEEMQTRIKKYTDTLRVGTGSPYPGKKLFQASCAKCHKLFGQGGEVGPDLTTYKRDDFSTMLLHIVNPSAEIREGFETLLVSTKNGRLLSGFLAEKDNQVLVLRTAEGQLVTLPQADLDEVQPQKKSLMPEGLLDNLSEQQVRDLFAYLRSTQPLND